MTRPALHVRGRILAAAAAAWLAGGLAPALAAPARLELTAVHRTGCGSGEFSFWLRRSGLSGGRYLVRTQVTLDGLQYMDERATIFRNGVTAWTLYDDHSHSPRAIGAAWPMPRGRPLRVELTLSRPSGQVLERQALGLDGCDTGRIRFRTPVMKDGFE